MICTDIDGIIKDEYKVKYVRTYLLSPVQLTLTKLGRRRKRAKRRTVQFTPI